MLYPNLCYNEVCYKGTVLYPMNTKISGAGLYMFQLAVSMLNVYLFCSHSIYIYIYEPRHEISNNVVCATSKASDQPTHMCSLIRAFASCLNIL